MCETGSEKMTSSERLRAVNYNMRGKEHKRKDNHREMKSKRKLVP